MSDDATTDGETTPEEEGSATTPNPPASTPQDEIASARKRQAGAEEARRVAEAKAAALEQELAQFRTANQTAQQAEMTELAREKARADQAEQRAAEAELKATARVLDAAYPNARKELPEVTDEVRLAKFEAMLKDDGDVSPPTPAVHKESKASTPAAKPKEKTAADWEAELLSAKLPDGWSV